MNLVKSDSTFSSIVQLVLFAVVIAWSGAYLGICAQGTKAALDDRFKKQSQGSGDVVTPPNLIVAPNEEYRIGAGDWIEVRVEDAPELAVPNARISPKGTFLMPYLQYVQAQGKTPEELSLAIAEKLRGRYLKNPQVSVLVKQVHSHTFIIQGAVRKPGVYQIEGRPSMMTLIGAAGGLLENHGSTSYVIRELKNPLKVTDTNKDEASTTVAASPADAAANPADNPKGAEEAVKYEMLTSNISALYKGRFDQDLRLEPGDIVNIPQTDVFYVAGEVNLPGEFPLKDGITLRQAIAMAQGPTMKAKPKNAVIFRENEKGQIQEIPVDVDSILKGKKDDVKLMANDIVALPNSALKSALLPILNAAGGGLGLTVGSGIIRR